MGTRLVISVAVLLGGLVAAQAEPLDCAAFEKNTDGSWSAKDSITFKGSNGNVTLERGTSFGRADTAEGLILADILDGQCGR